MATYSPGGARLISSSEGEDTIKGHLVSFGNSERIYEWGGSNLMLSHGQYKKNKIIQYL